MILILVNSLLWIKLHPTGRDVNTKNIAYDDVQNIFWVLWDLLFLKILIYLLYFTYSLLVLFQEHMDYEIIQSTNPDFNKAIVRVNIFREHRQTIQVQAL